MAITAADYDALDALGMAQAVAKGQVTAAELAEEAIRRIEAVNPKLNAVIDKTFDYARATARDSLPAGPFKGVPFLVKDLAVPWEGQRMTNGCAYWKDYVAPKDSDYAARQRAAGFVLLGRTNVPENGWCLSSEPRLYGPTKNPWKDGITAGGSSGGSAAAVAARILPLADASDGAGSIRVPASNNGLVGLKPSRGRIPLGPDIVDFWHGGALFLCVSRTLRDTAAYLDAVHWTQPGEPYQHARPERPFLEEVGRDPGKLKIAFTVKPLDGSTMHPEVAEGVKATAKLLESLGHHVEERDFAFDFEAMWKAYTRVIQVQTALFFDLAAASVGRPVTEADLMPTTWSIIQKGKSISATDHAWDVETIRIFSRQIGKECEPYDAYLMPVLAQPPRPLGHWPMTVDIDSYNARMAPDCVFTAPFNVSGQPGISLPLHWTSDGLPVGMQLVGRYSGEALLLRLAGQLEQAKPWADKRPPLAA